MDMGVPKARDDGAASAVDRLYACWNLQLFFFAHSDNFSIFDQDNAVGDWVGRRRRVDGSADQRETLIRWRIFHLRVNRWTKCKTEKAQNHQRCRASKRAKPRRFHIASR